MKKPFVKKRRHPSRRSDILWVLGSGVGFCLLMGLLWLDLTRPAPIIAGPEGLDSSALQFPQTALETTNPQQVTTRQTYHIAGQPVAQRVITTVDGVEVSNELHYLYTDHLGSVRTVSDSGGNVLGATSTCPTVAIAPSPPLA